MARRLHQTLADYVVIAISPALIMALVGSLVFFLLGVFYQGQFQERLYWVMACFVFAAVLIARIAIEEGLERAAPFGATLGVLVAIASSKFMEYQGGWIEQVGFLVNWGLIALIWWCAHRLTWDCTVIDDEQDASGEGLLQIAGLEKAEGSAESKAEQERRLEGTTSRTAPAGIWQRYVQHQRRPHAPGVWVVYFSLAALPLFGVGQWFIPESDVSGRRRAFWLLTVYVAAGIGLLLTTSFLGLRRYLRQRRIEMPTLMANLWLGTGAVIIVLLLVLTALLPRPSAEYAISELPFKLGSPDQQGSRHAPVARDGAQNEEEKGPAPQRASDDPSQQPESGDSPPPSGESGESRPDQSGSSSSQDAKQPGDSKDQSGSSDAKGQGKDGQSSDQGKQSSKQGESSEESKSDNASDRREQSQPESSPDQGKGKSESPSDTTQNEPGKEPSPSADAGKQEGAAKAPGEKPSDDSEQSSGDSEIGNAVRMLETGAETAASGLIEMLKWVLYAAIILAAAYFLWRFRAEVAAGFRDFLQGLRDFLSGLWGGRSRRDLPAAEALHIEIPPAPFSSFADPFATGIASRYSLAELVRYSFEAFEAWSREHDCPRLPDRTLHELVRDVTRRHGFIKSEANQLAELYARAAYARGELPDTTRQQLQSLWQKMRQGSARQPLGETNKRD